MKPLAARHHRFNYRVAGIIVDEGHVLLHRGEADRFWTMPGGRPELGEPSRDALVREMQEELGLRVEIERLLWIVENFFPDDAAAPDDPSLPAMWHELAFYYLVRLPVGSGFDAQRREFTGFEGDLPIIFRWFPCGRLHDVSLFPTFLRGALAALPRTPVHVVHTDPPKDHVFNSPTS